MRDIVFLDYGLEDYYSIKEITTNTTSILLNKNYRGPIVARFKDHLSSKLLLFVLFVTYKELSITSKSDSLYVYVLKRRLKFSIS